MMLASNRYTITNSYYLFESPVRFGKCDLTGSRRTNIPTLGIEDDLLTDIRQDNTRNTLKKLETHSIHEALMLVRTILPLEARVTFNKRGSNHP